MTSGRLRAILTPDKVMIALPILVGSVIQIGIIHAYVNLRILRVVLDSIRDFADLFISRTVSKATVVAQKTYLCQFLV